MLPNLKLALLGLVGSLALAIGAFFYGQHIGYQSCKAEQVDAIGGQFSQYAEDAANSAKAGTAAALADFNKRAGILEQVATDLRTSKGIMDNAASRLKASLAAGSCVLSPAQRRMLECIRRPGDTACTAPDL